MSRHSIKYLKLQEELSKLTRLLIAEQDEKKKSLKEFNDNIKDYKERIEAISAELGGECD